MLRAIMFRQQKSNKISGFDAMNRPPTQASVAAVQYARVDPSHRPSGRAMRAGYRGTIQVADLTLARPAF
jgi:hypothetical protein